MILAPLTNSQRRPATRPFGIPEHGPDASGRIGRPDPVYAGRGR